jgi:hypothetical protein
MKNKEREMKMLQINNFHTFFSSKSFYFCPFITKLNVTSPISRKTLEMENKESDMKMFQINNFHTFFLLHIYYKVNYNITNQYKSCKNEEQRKGYEDALDKKLP